MTAERWTALVLALVVVGLLLQYRAGRMDRLHLRLDAATEALDAQLVRRATAALELAGSGVLDPASSLALAEAAQRAAAAGPEDRSVAESQLSQTLRAVLDDAEAATEVLGDPTGEALLAEVRASAERVVLARRFHNDAVAAAQTLRRTRTVRWFGLAGHAAWPEPFDMDTGPPLGEP
jgi:hypothetical protein